MIAVRELTKARFKDLEALFASDPVADRCFCMWFIIPVKTFHEAGREGNRASFADLVASDTFPLGLIAYDAGQPVGWCAVGPRRRYVRAMAAPTLKQRDRSEDDTVWLVPCFFISPEARGSGVATALLEAAVEHARSSGAGAIEGFPLAGDKRRSGGSDFQTGMESLFAGCGFEPVSRPSENRVIMRREL
jgi:GNAT superfamily N-acetyltransferase